MMTTRRDFLIRSGATLATAATTGATTAAITGLPYEPELRNRAQTPVHREAV